MFVFLTDDRIIYSGLQLALFVGAISLAWQISPTQSGFCLAQWEVTGMQNQSRGQGSGIHQIVVKTAGWGYCVNYFCKEIFLIKKSSRLVWWKWVTKVENDEIETILGGITAEKINNQGRCQTFCMSLLLVWANWLQIIRISDQICEFHSPKSPASFPKPILRFNQQQPFVKSVPGQLGTKCLCVYQPVLKGNKNLSINKHGSVY